MTRALLLATTLAALTACDAKPKGEIPSLASNKTSKASERDVPNGPTLAAALDLLDPRSADPRDLDRRRTEFEQKLSTMVPDAAERKRMGFDEVLRWHKLFARRMESRKRSLTGHRKRLVAALKPAKGHVIRVDANGVARTCALEAEARPTKPGESTGACKTIPGHAQLDAELGTADADLRGLVEAQWYLQTQLQRVRTYLDPGSVGCTGDVAPGETAK
ncbi:MAG: hypothetical protein ACI9WU_005484 [Myxococcota bacterium]|jgi:hypothetical protein